mgnify:CR=1 FL=1
MYLTILLLACLFTILSIYLLKIKKQNEQIIIFIVTFVLLCCFYKLCGVLMPYNEDIDSELEEPDNDFEEQNLKMEILDKDMEDESSCEIKQKETHTPDEIIPLDSYNKDDCTNDNSCLIQPDAQNMFPGHIEINKKREECSEKVTPLKINDDFLNNDENLNNFEELNDKNKNLIINNDQIDELKTCQNCKKVLNLLNRPTTEKFNYKNPLDITHDCNSFKIHNLDKEQNTCIHCSQFY